MLESVALGELPSFRSIVAHDGDQRRVSSSMRKRGEDGDLSDMAEADYRVTYGTSWGHHGLLNGHSKALRARRVSTRRSLPQSAELEERMVLRECALPSLEQQPRRQTTERHAISSVAQCEPVAGVAAVWADVRQAVWGDRE